MLPELRSARLRRPLPPLPPGKKDIKTQTHTHTSNVWHASVRALQSRRKWSRWDKDGHGGGVATCSHRRHKGNLSRPCLLLFIALLSAAQLDLGFVYSPRSQKVMKAARPWQMNVFTRTQRKGDQGGRSLRRRTTRDLCFCRKPARTPEKVSRGKRR